MSKTRGAHVCAVCGMTFANRDMYPGEALRTGVLQEITREHPGWRPSRRPSS